MKEIAVLIASHNRKEKTIQCLNTLFSQIELQNSFVLSVFLVDDGSTDGTKNKISELFPKVSIIEGTGKLFWNRGMHLAWSSALNTKKNFDYYLWLNDDVSLYENALLEVLNCAIEKKDKSIICGILETSMHSNQISYGGGNIIDNRYAPNLPNGVMSECTILNGNVVLIPQKVYQIIGNLDPIYPHAIGDHDYGLRAKKKNIKSYTTRSFIGSCQKNESLSKWCLPHISFMNRLKSLYSPLGNSHPYYYFIFEKRHYGILTAIKHFITIHIRLFFPKLWEVK
jgi:GT2 family glycosyltransferase